MQTRMRRALWPALLALQLLALTVLTLRAPADLILDADAAKVYANVMEMWHTKSLVIPGWRYLTTMELDCAALLALPLYALCGDILLAFRLCGVLLPPLWTAVILALFRRMERPRDEGCLAAVLVLLPYSFGMLEYWNMLFLNAAQYTVKVLLPLLFICLLLPPRSGRRGAGQAALLAVYLALVVCSAFSSGVYVLLCGLLPVALYHLGRRAWQGRCPTRYELAVLAGSAAAGAGGLALGRMVDATAKGNAMCLNDIGTWADNAARCLVGIFQLFGAVRPQKTPVLTLDGLYQLTMLCLALLLLAVLVWSARRLLRGRPGPGGYLTALALGNLFVLLVCDTRFGETAFEYRYHLMGMVPVLLLAAQALPAWLAALPQPLRRAAPAGLAAATLLLAGFTDLQAARAVRPAALAGEVAARARGLIELIDAQAPAVQEVYVHNHSGLAEICRTLDPDRRYTTYVPGYNSLYVYDYYLADADTTTHSGPHLYFMMDGAVPDGDAVYLGAVEEWTVYLGDAGHMDGVCGLPMGDCMVDYPDSPAYTFDGTVDGERRLHAVGSEAVPWVVRSPTLTLHAMTDITLDYTLQTPDAAPGLLELWVGETQLMTAPLDGSGTAAFSGIAPGEYILKVSLPAGTAATLGPITFRRTGT